MKNLKVTSVQIAIIKNLIYDKIDQTDSDYYRDLLNNINKNNPS